MAQTEGLEMRKYEYISVRVPANGISISTKWDYRALCVILRILKAEREGGLCTWLGGVVGQGLKRFRVFKRIETRGWLNSEWGSSVGVKDNIILDDENGYGFGLIAFFSIWVEVSMCVCMSC